MSDKKEKKYVKGSSRQINDDFIVISLSRNQLAELFKEYGDKFNTKKGDDAYIPIGISRKRETDEYGNTHYMYVNEYKPKEKKDADPMKDYKNNIKEDDLPF